MTKQRFAKSLLTLAATSALTFAFLAASVRPMRAQGPVLAQGTAQATAQQDYRQAGHTYWHYADYDAVLDIWQTPAGPHVKVHSINPANAKLREKLAKEAKKDPKDLTAADFMKFANYEAQLSDMKQTKPGLWKGKILIESLKTHFGVDIQFPQGDQKDLKIRGYLSEGWRKWVTLGNPGNVVGLTFDFTPVENPPAPGLNAPLPQPPAVPLPAPKTL